MSAQRSILLVLSIVLLLLPGCAAIEYSFTEHGTAYKKAEDSYNAGDFDGAVRNCVVALSMNPNYKKASLLLKEVAPKAYESHENKAKEYSEWDRVVTEYDALLALAESVSSLEGSYPTIDADSISQKREYAVQKAAEAHYGKGVSLMESGRYKEAANEFKESQHFVPGYKDAESLYTRSRAAAIKRIAIIPFENMTGETQFGDIGTLLVDRSIGAAISIALDSLELVDFITRDYLDQLMAEHQIGRIADIQSNPRETGKSLGIHAFVFGKIDSLVVDYPPRTSEVYNRETTIYREAAEGGSYKVSAKCSRYIETGEVTISAQFQVISVASGSIMKSDTLEASAISEVQWVRFKGDERALTVEDADLSAQEEGTPAPAEVLVDSAIDQLGNDLAIKLVDFFSQM